MFCENCGAKAKENAKFCEECGQPLKKKEPKEKKKLSNKTKVVLVTLVCVVIIAVWACLTVANKFKPETIALDYFKAYSSNDASTLYDYLNVENKDFTSKKIYKELMKDAEDKNITNYTATSSNISVDGLEATVTIKYVINGTKTNTMNVKLVKNSKKKMLIFDNWQVVSDIETVKDYNIKVMKDSVVKVAGIKLDKSYLDQKNSTDSFDVYKIPEMLEASYPAEVTFPMGIKTETTIKPSSTFKRTTLDFDLDDVSKADKSNLEKVTLDSVQYIYNSALEEKNFNDIKEKFVVKNSEVEETYNTFKDSLNKRAESLESIKFTKAVINRATITDDGYLKLSVKLSYDYKADEDSSSSSYSSITLDTKNGYKIADFNNFKTYF